MCHFVAPVFSLWVFKGWPVCDLLSIISLGLQCVELVLFNLFLKSLTSLPTILLACFSDCDYVCISAFGFVPELWCPGCAFYYWLFFPTVCFIVGSFSAFSCLLAFLLCPRKTTKPLQRASFQLCTHHFSSFYLHPCDWDEMLHPFIHFVQFPLKLSGLLVTVTLKSWSVISRLSVLCAPFSLLLSYGSHFAAASLALVVKCWQHVSSGSLTSPWAGSKGSEAGSLGHNQESNPGFCVSLSLCKKLNFWRRRVGQLGFDSGDSRSL